ncbi:MAG: hypothetical protein WCQ95_06180 [Bacteroidota bacterium]
MGSSKKHRNRILIAYFVSWLVVSLFLIIIIYNEHHSLDVVGYIIGLIILSILFTPFIGITLWTYHRDVDKVMFFENDKIIVTKKEKKLIINKEDIREIKRYSRLFYSDLTIDLSSDIRFKISNAHADYKETIKKLVSWDIPIRFS